MSTERNLIETPGWVFSQNMIQCTLYMYLFSCAGRQDLLVMIDQHAAHERVRLEALTAGTPLCVDC